MGSDSIKKGLAAAGRSTIDGAVAVSKKGIKASKTHYEKSKAMRGGKSSGSSAGTSSQSYETQTRLSQLPDPRQFPPPPLRPEHRQHAGSAGVAGSTSSSMSSPAVSAGRGSAMGAVAATAAPAVRTSPGSVSAMGAAQGSPYPAQPIAPSHSTEASGRPGYGNVPSVGASTHPPLPARPGSVTQSGQPPTNVSPVARMQQNASPYGAQGQASYGTHEQVTQGAASAEPVPPPIPVRNYGPTATPTAQPSRLPSELPPYPYMPSDDSSYDAGLVPQPTPSQLPACPQAPSTNVDVGINVAGQPAPSQLPPRSQVAGNAFTSQPAQDQTAIAAPQPKVQVKPYNWGATKEERETNKIIVPQVEVTALPPPPKHRDRGASTSPPAAPLPHSSTGPKPSLPARRSPSEFASPITTGTGTGGLQTYQLENKSQQLGRAQSASTSASTLPRSSPKYERAASFAKTGEESSGPSKGITGEYNYEISVSFEPPPKPYKRGDGQQSRSSPFSSSRGDSITAPESTGSPARGSSRYSALNSTDPPPPYTDAVHGRIGSDSPAPPAAPQRSPAPPAAPQRSSAGRSLPPVTSERSLPAPAWQGGGPMASQLSEEASSIVLRKVTSLEGSQTGDGIGAKKKPPLVPKKKDSLAGNKKAPPPVPKKKATLSQGLSRDAAASTGAAEVPSSSGIDTSSQDDNPFRRYLKTVVPEENDRVHHR
ncbi:AaceriADL336Cp [[Ashbya] aceris (nom. inval.)]|nr:AaceriADL336Cp [[Ashbya] aceris (nom. inval.)]